MPLDLLATLMEGSAFVLGVLTAGLATSGAALVAGYLVSD
jgi:hypothetical protein